MLEIACFEITSAEIALRSVADRIEFCSGREVGGLTPEIEEFRYLNAVYQKPIYVMIRPKGGSFMYTDLEFDQMKRDVAAFRKLGAKGFVFGVLTSGNQIDVERNKILVELAEDVPCTFHRAFDRTANLEDSIEKLINLRFSTVLTSGGKNDAMDGKEHLKNLIEKYGHKINILIGGGVRSRNIGELKDFTGARQFHSSAIPDYEIYASDEEIKNMKKQI